MEILKRDFKTSNFFKSTGVDWLPLKHIPSIIGDYLFCLMKHFPLNVMYRNV